MLHDASEAHLFSQLAAGRDRAPLTGQWELTYRCNLKCVMCYTDCLNTPEHVRRELTLEEIKRIADELQDAGVLQVVLTGGEPTVRPDFIEIYTHLFHKGIQLTVFTNGTALTPRLLEVWSRHVPYMVEVSLHGLGGRFDEITGVRGSYERCLHGVEQLLARRIPVTLKTVGMTLNRDQLLDIKRLAESHQGAQWYLGEEMRPALTGDESPLQYQLSQETFGEIAAHDVKMFREHEHITERRVHRPSEAELSTNRCGSRFKFHIDAYGGLQLCSANRRRTYDLRTGSFRDGFYNALPQFPCINNPTTRHLIDDSSPVQSVTTGE